VQANAPEDGGSERHFLGFVFKGFTHHAWEKRS